MENNAMTAPLDKKTVLKNLIEKGKANGKLTTQDIDQAILDIDLDLEDLDKLYETIENQNIELVDDLSNVDLEDVDFNMDMPSLQSLQPKMLTIKIREQTILSRFILKRSDVFRFLRPRKKSTLQ